MPRTLSPHGGFHVGYIGHLYPGKGMETIAALAPLCPWATFHIVGGYSEDIEKWQVETKNLPNITFHGFQQQTALPGFLAAFDAVLAPYQRKVYGHKGTSNLADWMSPLKLFEYMAAGKPILCSDLPVLREVLTDRRNGLLCTPEDIQAWQKALETLCDDFDLAQKLGRQAKQDFLEHYTWDARARSIIEILSGFYNAGS